MTAPVKYDLAAMATKQKGMVAVLPEIHPSAAAEMELRKAMRDILRGARGEVRERLLPAIAADLKRGASSVTQDMGAEGESALGALRDLIDRLVAAAHGMADRIFRREGGRHTKKVLDQANRIIGVDLSAVVREDDLEDYLRAASQRNATYIKSLGDDLQKRIAAAAYEATINGSSVKNFKDRLTKEFGIVDRRAQFIAQDQMAKLNSELTELRHTQAGVTSYVWSSSRDERVRGLHRAIDGTVYQYGKPTGAEDGLPPGRPPRCRCVARAVVKFGGETHLPKKFPADPPVWSRPNESLTAKQKRSALRKQAEYLAIRSAAR